MTLFPDLNLTLANLPAVRGVSTIDLLELPEMVGRVLSGIVRKRGLTLKEFSVEIGLNQEEAQHLLDILIEKGYLCKEFPLELDETRFCVNFVKIRRHSMLPNVLSSKK
jgi:hypothetical protein